MAISSKNSKIIWIRFGGKCAICNEDLIEKVTKTNYSLVGEVAHIVGEKAKAARGNHPMSVEERNSPSNLLLLCRKHHKIIDDHEDKYTIEKLQSIKKKHLENLYHSIPKNIKLNIDIYHLSYINVPRLSELAINYGYKVDLTHFKDGKKLDDLGFNLVYLIDSFRQTLSHVKVDAIPFDNIFELNEKLIGSLVSFNNVRFRTKVFSKNNDYPHIYYLHDRGWKLILQIDKKFITTTTAHCNFSPTGGTFTFSGLFRIKDIDFMNDTITASALVLGTPQNSFDRFREENIVSSKRIEINNNLDENIKKYIDFTKAMQQRNYAYFNQYICDFCQKDLNDDEYFIDGKTKSGSWALMCTKCFVTEGIDIGFGQGQLYGKAEDKWLMLGGHPPEGEDEYFL